ncbi:putative spermidine/putrescine transport system permease protein [Labrenzia sp. EL_208]|uniref:Inner membrane ABC transporter permease protein YdcV n=1 Tax=Roseibium album TaxID=311410 RepID=A0A0M7B4D4_9HYPH|nr:ABC transporter permease [Roseibium album]MBG6147192.1 putative spermidine/putrescine transport system permease protein [Labrenzia sp. EL_142]MBG6159722.1 putative spermidine/putrescine transport system permease protein [Labrenzia sp. EL_162]MBG6176486.1 putative spermidine/putrescine transport system permease protein [Labrenzia sp. EL_132]MBG6198254.1 putative spermidine/putrescine transport system permease protein [Labrenzia sp. EL_159]MBG6201873.1 putative spermidine/putrescine transport
MSRLTIWLILGTTLTFLIGPFLIVIFAGASAGETLTFPPQGLSLKWYAKVFTVESFRDSFALSMFLAIFGTLTALLIGIPAAYALNRYNLPGAEAIRTIVAAPIIVPGIIVGLALLRYFVVPLDVTITMALFVTHTALVLPYAVRVVSSSLNNLRADMEEAAVILGCTRFQAFVKVVLPNIRGGILAAFILGFVTSFNEVPASLFLSGPGVRTLPIDMLSYMEITFDPSVAALSALLAFMSVAIVFVAERLLGFSRYV